MNRSGKFGYFVGFSLALIVVYGLYFIGIVGVVIDLWNKELPIDPLILILLVSSWRKLLQIYVSLNINAHMIEIRNSLLAKDSRNKDLDSLMSKIRPNQYGGPN